MHPLTTKSQFIELRAQDLSLASIAEQLNVAPSTLLAWQHELQPQIDNERSFFLDALHEQVCSSYGTELKCLVGRLNKLEAILAQREFDDLSTASLVTLAGSLRNQIRKHLQTPRFTLPPTPPASALPIDPACLI